MGNNEILDAYIYDVNSHIDRCEQILINCEKQNVFDIDSINQIFRLMHDIKSASIAMEYNTISKISHRIEDVLSFVKKNELYGTNDTNLFILCFKAIDLLKAKIKCIQVGEVPSDNIGNFEEEIALFLMNNYISYQKTDALNSNNKKAPENNYNKSNPYISVSKDKINALNDIINEIKSLHTEEFRINFIENSPNSELLEKLINLTTELCIIAKSIQYVPLYSVFNNLNRPVRDMTKKLNKNVDLKIEGGDIEVDSLIAESISSPIMHLVKNSLDHGIESTQERINLGKPEKGVINIKAKTDGNELIISVYDDGSGFDEEEILKKARKKGLLQKPENEYEKSEIFSLLLQTGFSTKDKISVYSGRGMGLDIVNTNIQKIGGNVTIEGKQNVFSLITIKIPLNN